MAGLDRRDVTRAAVWAVPVVTLATAAPAFAAGSTPACPTCLTTIGGTFSESAPTSSGVTTSGVTGSVQFGINALSCDLSLFQPGFIMTVNSVSVGYTNGSSQNFSSFTGGGAGSLGGLFTIGFSSPTNTVNIGGATSTVKPNSMTIGFTLSFVTLGGLTVNCKYSSAISLTTTRTPFVVGSGATFAGTASGGTPTPVA